MDVLRYDSYNVLVANCAPAHRRMPFNLTANTTYRNANGYLACGQQPFPTMYNVFTACWGLVALGLLLRVARDSDSSVQQEYTTKNELVVVVLSIPLLFGVHGQTASAGYRLSDKVGLLDPPPFWWLRPVLYVARETAMYGTVLVLATGWRVAPREHCKDHVFTICLWHHHTPEHSKGLVTFVVTVATGVLGVDAITAFLYDFRSNQLLVCTTTTQHTNQHRNTH